MIGGGGGHGGRSTRENFMASRRESAEDGSDGTGRNRFNDEEKM